MHSSLHYRACVKRVHFNTHHLFVAAGVSAPGRVAISDRRHLRRVVGCDVIVETSELEALLVVSAAEGRTNDSQSAAHVSIHCRRGVARLR